MLHAALLLWVAGAGHLLHGNVDLHAMAWLLVGSIPGVLIGSHLSVRVPGACAPHRVRLRAGPLGDQARRGSRRDDDHRGRRRRSAWSSLVVWSVARSCSKRSAVPLHDARVVESPGVARVLSTAVVLALLAATAVAFAVTEGAKLEQVADRRDERRRRSSRRTAPIAAESRAIVSSGCGRASGSTVWIQDARRQPRARRCCRPRTFRARRARSTSSGTASPTAGIVEPDGVYMPVVKLERSHRTIVLPSPIRLDTKPPVITVTHPQYPIISPDGDGHARHLPRPYTLNEPAHAILPCAAAASSSRAARS